MEFPVSARIPAPPPSMVDLQKPLASRAQTTVLPAPLSVDEARIAARTALEPHEKTAIIRALLANPHASAEALSLATQIAAQSQQAMAGYTSARPTIESLVTSTQKA